MYMDTSAKEIVFFNAFNNGDLHYSRQFVKHIMSSIGLNASYAHNKCEYLLADTGLKCKRIDLQPFREKSFVVAPDLGLLLMNTWVAQEHQKWFEGCTLHANYRMFTETCSHLGISLLPESEYIPVIDYSFFEGTKHCSIETDKNIFVSNGPALSGQGRNFDLDSVVEKLASRYPSCKFFVTAPFATGRTNILDANKVVPFVEGRSNLNELSYLSTKCSVIVGRASGPFCFSHVRDNLLDPEKTFIVFSNDPKEGHWVTMSDYDFPQHAKQIWGKCHIGESTDCSSMAYEMIDAEINAKFGSR